MSKIIRDSRRRNDRVFESGQAIILIALSILGIFGISALAIDGGNAYLERRKAQNAADAAALAGAIARIEGTDWRQAALTAAVSNGYDNNGVSNTVELNTPPINGPYMNNPEYIQVIITSHLDTYFGPVIGIPSLTISTQAVSQTKPAEYGEMFDGYAVVSLAPHSKCEPKPAFWIGGEATLALDGGGLFVNSDNPTCAYIQQASGSLRIVDDSPFSIVGGASIQKPKLHTPYPPKTGAIPMSYPPAIQMPRIGCGSRVAEVVGEELTIMTPGNWDDDFPPEGVTNLEPGVYCIGGDVIVDGGTELIGSGVILVVKRGSVQFSNNATIQLSAPMSGDSSKGLLLYMPLDNHKRLNLGGNGASNFKGTILAPSAEVHINGMGSSRGFHSQIIGYTIEVDGNDIINVKYRDEQNYDAYRMPEIQLSQ